MSSWSAKRKTGYFFIFTAIVVLLIGVPFFFLVYQKPTCSDGVMNGTERGIDCGGSCAKLCPADFASPRVLWSYSVQVVPEIYNTLAYVQNPNVGVEAVNVPYLIKIYDAEGILVTQKTGKAFIPAGQKFAVFEGGINVGKRNPARTTFEFTGEPNWRVGAMLSKLRVLDTSLDQGTQPKAEARVKNESVDQTFSSVTAFIVLYDKDNNRVSFSKTLIESIGAGEEQTLYFTWPTGFDRQVVRTEVLFVANPSR